MANHVVQQTHESPNRSAQNDEHLKIYQAIKNIWNWDNINHIIFLGRL